jgi:O-antigen/teichoic acid export membrane protein
MIRIRRALLFTLAERYINLIVNFALISIVSRLLSPAEIGISIVGATIVGIIEIARDIPSPYLVQEKELGRDEVATAFTCMLMMSIAFGVILFSCSGLIGRLYGDGNLAPYCRLLAVGLLPGSFERPIVALMRRNMAFDHLAVINVSGAVVNMTVTLVLAAAGFRFMAFAWAALAGNTTVAILAFVFQRDLTIFRLCLSKWRRALALGAYSGAWGITAQIPEFTSYLLLGRFLRIEAVGLYSRARIVNDMPGKLLLSGLAPVAFPALAAEARAGRSLSQPYLLTLSIVSALYWPAFLMLAILARPIVVILLGQQWVGIVPVVQIIAIANLFSVSRPLTQPILTAVGAVRELWLSALIVLPVGLILTSLGASFGLEALAWSLVLKAPIDAAVELVFIRRHAHWAWTEFFAALQKSAVVAICTAALPAILLTASAGLNSIMSLAIAIPLAMSGWIAGLYITGHPLAGELALAAVAVRRRWNSGLSAVARLRPRVASGR